MALAAFPSTSCVGSLCLRKRLHHYRTARLARPSYWKRVCLSIPRPHCVSLFSPHWLKSPARVIPSWGTQLDSSVATPPSRLRWHRAHPLASTPVSMVQGCWPRRSRSRLLAHSWHSYGLVIRPREPRLSSFRSASSLNPKVLVMIEVQGTSDRSSRSTL